MRIVVLIIKKVVGKRHDVIFIPKRPLYDMLERHVARDGLAKGRPNTCIVTSKDDWTGKPNFNLVVDMILKSLKYQRVLEGENRYPILHKLFHKLKCREFNFYGKNGMPISKEFDGDFVIDFVRIKGKGKLAIKKLEAYESIGLFEKLKIKNIFKKIETLGGNEMVFFARHIHPARRR